ncbi:MAG: FkbM family methyltransferase [Phycisphaerales bacterium]|nr:FkbM family methyltransferase [Phycisphaerales bacterium]
MWIAFSVLVLAVLAIVVHGEKRHARLRRRLRDLTGEVRSISSRCDRAERHTHALRTRASLAAAGRSPRLPVQFVSQFGEDAWIMDLFEGKLEGVYLEVGAFDGVLLSTTYALEAIGWRGLLIEPLEDRFVACQKQRPGSVVVRAAVGKRGSSGTTSFEQIVGTGQGALADVASSIALPEHQRNQARRYDASVRKIEVPLTTLAELLDRANFGTRIDVAVIDVEGFEFEAIDGLEIDRHRPRVLIVEDLTGGKEERVAGVLRAAGYVESVMIGHNRTWIDGREESLVRRARMLELGGAVRE